jgi:hypothetical protein
MHDLLIGGTARYWKRGRIPATLFFMSAYE